MNLIVATRVEDQHLRFEVEGKWGGNDALQLAYVIKAAALRAGRSRALIDLRRVRPDAQAQGLFEIFDALRRALAAEARVALVVPAGIVDDSVLAPGRAPSVTINSFSQEGFALQWLHAD